MVGGNVCRALTEKRTTNYLFAVRQGKNARQTFFCRAFFSPCAGGRTHGRAPLCRAPEKMRRQSFKRTAKREFPVVRVRREGM
jgi:hypothetical protein